MNAPERHSTWLLPGLLLLLLAALPAEGGAQPDGLLLWHTLLVLLLLFRLAGADAAGAGGPPAFLPIFPFGLFLALALAGGVLAPYGYAAFLELLELGAFTAVAFLAARCGATLLSRISFPLLVAGAVEGVIAIGQRVAQGEVRPSGTFLNPNHLAAWLVAILLLNAGPVLTGAGRRGPRIARLVLALPVATGLLLTGSRGALAGLLVGSLYLMVNAWRGLSRAGRRSLIALAVLVVLLIAVRIGGRQSEPDPYRYYRLKIWKASVQTVLESPWLGTGLGQFAVAAENLNFPDEREPLRYDRRFRNTHSDLLRPFCELGWPGGLALLAALLLAARELRRRRRNGTLGEQCDGALAALLALGAQAMVDNLSERPAVYLLAAVALGSLLSTGVDRGARDDPAGSRTRLPAGPRAILAAVLVALFVVGDLAPYLAWRQLSGLPLGRLDPVQLERVERAQRLNPLHPHPWLYRSRHIAGDGSDWDLERYAAAREAAEHAIRLQPADQRYRLALAWVEGLANRTLFRDAATRERARARYREAQQRSIHDPMIPIELAKFLLDTGDPAGARRAAEVALAIEPNAVLPRLLLADSILDQGGPAAASRAAGLLEEAGAISERWGDRRRDGPYSDDLLRLDRRAFDRIARKLADAGDRSGGPEEGG